MTQKDFPPPATPRPEEQQAVEFVRRFKNGWSCGVGLGARTDCVEWFVFDRTDDAAPWRMHCGPYATPEEGKWWISQIREV